MSASIMLPTLTHCRFTGIGFAGPVTTSPATGATCAASAGAGTGESMTHEGFVHAVRALAVERTVDPATRAKLLGAKLVYGIGPGTYRGVCYHGAWQNGEPRDFIEIAATGEESPVQLAGTTIHETAHALAGVVHGHDATWRDCCAILGLRTAVASGQSYAPDHFETELWAKISALPTPNDGAPQFASMAGGFIGLPMPKVRPCPMGKGTRGGKFGPGSGSRLRLWQCECKPDPEQGITNKARVASDEWQATCKRCGADFVKVEKKA